MVTREATRTPVDVRATVAANVRAEAARLGYTQVRLGRELGLSQGQITTRWKNIQPWQLDELGALAALLRVNVADLVTPAARLKGLEPPTFWFGVARDWMVAA